MHVATFHFVNAIEPLHQPYKTKLQAPTTTSKEAAASVAAAASRAGDKVPGPRG